ncbi:exodeoxyribonuclease VII large subunit [Paradesulfitobacterium aromaticivorans]
MPKIWTVSELASEIGRTLTEKGDFQSCWVSGEISNFKNHRPSGHWYFTIKDQHASLKAVMFKSRAERIGFMPQDGMKVLTRGGVRMYERDGNIQFYAEELQPSGVGALYLAFEQLKGRLAEEGLFDANRKKPIPRVPRRIGIVTSPTGAALHDVLNILSRRNPRISWVLAPAAVQGEAAPQEVARALARLNRYGEVDVIIVGRGGGSLEELWAFNTEEVARAIAASSIPVISAVGHETDVTIADYVADLRAPTPSAAAELAAPLLQELYAEVNLLSQGLRQALAGQIAGKRQKLDFLAGRGPLVNPFWRIEQNRQHLDILADRLANGMTRFVSDKNGILKLLAAKLDLLSPLAILGRGYSLAYDARGNLVRSAREVEVQAEVRVRLGEGALKCQVLAKENEA